MPPTTSALATRDPANGLSFKFARQSLPPRTVPLRLSRRLAWNISSALFVVLRRRERMQL